MKLAHAALPLTASGLPLAPQLETDVMLTAMVLRHARDTWMGQIAPETLFGEWLAIRRTESRDFPTELALAIRENRLPAFMESLHPERTAYQRLRKARQRYEAMRQAGGWPVIPDGPTLRQGSTGSRVAALIQRLEVGGDFVASPATDLNEDLFFDDPLAAAVKRFQTRHGLTPDGAVGKRTLAALNVPIDRRISQLDLNMERWRWYPDDFGKRYVLVNIPAFELDVVDAGETTTKMRVVVGKNRRPTPIMSSEMTYMEVNPYWTVPIKIARKDILPKVIKDPAYLSRQGIRVFAGWDRHAPEIQPTQIAWRDVSRRNFPYRLRQEPSKHNALGRIKFMFPNPHSVYIHDTPHKSLFKRDRRNFSSGCVRVEKPVTLAGDLLRNQGWDEDRLKSAITSGKRRSIRLKTALPVHLVYFTAWVDDKGDTHFRNDIYGHDTRLLQAMHAFSDEPLLRCSNGIDGKERLASHAGDNGIIVSQTPG
ncbi:L,D-transpeptidase family protein [Desulfosarcina cetonica]|uniref:L,D-transpeptidase family protein n=1 Tax=Desulfosarcina cetonica TaxID=90730 RepID=UPI0006CF82BA|nr:L,D-transpeptidase family protein [Desulfosarcina cetonica]